MNALNDLGYSIYRLKEAKENDEFLLYVHKTKLYYFYSKKRLLDIFKKLLDDNSFDFAKLAEILKIDKEIKNINKEKVVNFLVEDNYIMIDNIGYMPSDKEIFNKDNKVLFNTYRKSEFLQKFKINEDLDFPNIRILMLNLVDHNQEEYEYFCKWLAFILQHPLQRLSTSIILQGEQGTGKTQFCNLVLKNIFGNNFLEIGQSQIESVFDEFIMGRQLIVANEVMHNETKFQMSEKLKKWVCDVSFPIRRMYKGLLEIDNYSQWIFTSNQLVVIKIEQGDRRYSVFKSKKLKDGWKLIGDLKKNLQEELTAFVSYLYTLEVEYEEVDKPFENDNKKEIINACRSNVEEFIDEFREFGGLAELAEDLKVNLDLRVYSTGTENIIKVSEVYKLYCFYCERSNIKKYSKNNFGRHLKNNGYENKVVRLDGETVRGIIV